MIEISTIIAASLDDVWNKWNSVVDIKNWAFASDDWAAEGIENDVKIGGVFKARNFAKDGSMEFIMEHTYDQVDPKKLLAYTMGDGRKVQIAFAETENGTRIDQTFEPESENSEEMQRNGWQSYLDNFKKFVETTV